MKFINFYQIREFDYKSIENRLSKEIISDELKNDIKKIIADHKVMVQTRKRIIKHQRETAGGLFQLFNDSNFQVENLNENQTEEGTPTQKPSTEPEKIHNPRKKYGKNKLPPGDVFHHPFPEVEKTCPCCNVKMHKQNSRTKTYVLAVPMMKTETHVSESYRCPSCENKTTANDGIENQCIGRYHFSAVSAILTLRYQCGMASYRMEQLSDAFGIQISDSTQWYIAENAATILRPFVLYLEKEVANAPIQHVDDTHNLVLDIVKSIEEEQERAILEGKKASSIRSGIHTTNLTGVFPDGKIVLYKTGLHHAGEILAKILEKRTIEEQLIIMADASSANTSKIDLTEDVDIKIANCNSHVVRKFIDIADKEEDIAKENRKIDHKTSDYLDYFIFRYKTIFENDKKTKEMNSGERLIFHIKYSKPLMQEMENEARQIISKKTFEPNSEVGKNFKYFLNHFEKLTAFCYFEGAPICNNLSERMLKCIIRHRKNSLFFKSQIGAAVADILTSILFTAKANDLNSTEYLRDLLTYKNLWMKNPQEWLPWNYKNTIQKLQNQSK